MKRRKASTTMGMDITTITKKDALEAIIAPVATTITTTGGTRRNTALRPWYITVDLNKFDRFVATQWPSNIIRAKGILYFSHNRDMCYLFEQAGVQKNLSESGLWYATAPAGELERLMASDPTLCMDWDDTYGDRMVKLVFIGQHLDRDALAASFDACLSPF